MITLTIGSEGEYHVKRQLVRFAHDLENPRSAMEAVGDILRASARDQFETEGGHGAGDRARDERGRFIPGQSGGAGWPALTAARVKFKAEHGLDPRILRATGALWASLVSKWGEDHVEEIAPSGDSLRFGTRVHYAIYHGSRAPRRKMPYRPPIVISEGDKREMVKRMQRALIDEARSA